MCFDSEFCQELEFVIISRNTYWIHSEFEKYQVYFYLIREKDSEFIVTLETSSQFIDSEFPKTIVDS